MSKNRIPSRPTQKKKGFKFSTIFLVKPSVCNTSYISVNMNMKNFISFHFKILFYETCLRKTCYAVSEVEKE